MSEVLAHWPAILAAGSVLISLVLFMLLIIDLMRNSYRDEDWVCPECGEPYEVDDKGSVSTHIL